MTFYALILVAVFVVIFFLTFSAIISRYKRCPSDKILVVYGKIGRSKEGSSQSSKTIHGGATFVWPVFQNFAFLDLTPISIEVLLQKALSKQNIRVDVPSRFTVGISTQENVMRNAAERLLGLELAEIQELAKDIIFGQLRLVIATMDIEEINTDRDKFLVNVSNNVDAELQKIGLTLINVNVTDINDESGYIEALGKEAAAKAINDAKKSVAEKNRDGEIGQAIAEKDQRISVSESNALAIKGENLARIQIAQSEAERKEKEAEANRLATAAEKVQGAKALEEAYVAEQLAETQRALKERATQEADVVVYAEIDKQKVQIDADAEAEKIRRIAKGQADGILFQKQAEAQGMLEILTKQAEGLDKIVKAAGNNSKDAVLLLIADKLPELVKTQSEAIKNIKIDKLTVWDSGNKDGKTGTANFVSGLYKAIPPLNDVFNMAGMDLPSYLKGEEKEQEPTKKATEKKDKETLKDVA